MRKTILIDFDGPLGEWDENGDYKAPGYSRTRPVVKETIEAIKALHDEGYSTILFSAVVNEDATKDKVAWCRENAPFLLDCDPIFIPYGKSKATYIPR